MPRTPIDYSKTLIYKLVHKDDLENENVYVGSTTDFRTRKNAHKTTCTNPKSKNYKCKVYQQIRENDGWDAWVMVEIEKFPCTDKREADARERYWCEHYKSELNMLVPGRTIQEWRDVHKDEIKKDCKEYYETHKDEIRKYQVVHKERIRKYLREYTQMNKEHINTQSREKVTCECGKTMNKSSLWIHKNNICKSLQVA